MTSWARRLAGLDLLSKKGRGSANAAAAGSNRRGARSAHSGRHFLAEKYAGDDSIVMMSGGCSGGRGGVMRADDDDDDDEDEGADVEDAVYDHSDNLARCCREFYEKRTLRAAEERLKPSAKSASSSDLKSLTTVSACSSGYFSLNTADSPATTVTANAVPDDIKGIVDSASGLQPKLEYLKRELLGLMDQDNELFKQLLMLNDAIEEIKAASTAAAPFEVTGPIAEHLEEEESDGDLDAIARQPLSFDPSDATCSSPLKRSGRTFTSPIQVTESKLHQSSPTFNLSLPVSHFQQSRQPPPIQQPTALFPLAEGQPVTPPDSISVDEDTEGDEEDLINELLDEALNLSCSSSDTSSHCGSASAAPGAFVAETPICPSVVNSKNDSADCEERSVSGGGSGHGGSLDMELGRKDVLFDDVFSAGSSPPAPVVLRTQSVLLRSGFQRQRVSFPATGRNRRKNSPPVKRELPPPLPPPPPHHAAHVRTLPSSMKKKPSETVTLDRRVLPIPPRAPPPPLPLLASVTASAAETTAKEWRHVKQSSIDSGIIQSISSSLSSSSSSSSSSQSQSGSDSASEANSDMAM